jgi:hypothetical protein
VRSANLPFFGLNGFSEQLRQQERHSTIDVLSDDEIYALIDHRQDKDAVGFKHDPGITFHDSLVYRITHDAVVKCGFDWEIYAMPCVSSQTSIPIPKIRQVLPIRPSVEFEQWIGETRETA